MPAARGWAFACQSVRGHVPALRLPRRSAALATSAMALQRGSRTPRRWLAVIPSDGAAAGFTESVGVLHRLFTATVDTMGNEERKSRWDCSQEAQDLPAAPRAPPLASMLVTTDNPTVAVAAAVGMTPTLTRLIAARTRFALPFPRAASRTAIRSTPDTRRDIHHRRGVCGWEEIPACRRSVSCAKHPPLSSEAGAARPAFASRGSVATPTETWTLDRPPSLLTAVCTAAPSGCVVRRKRRRTQASPTVASIRNVLEAHCEASRALRPTGELTIVGSTEHLADLRAVFALDAADRMSSQPAPVLRPKGPPSQWRAQVSSSRSTP